MVENGSPEGSLRFARPGFTAEGLLGLGWLMMMEQRKKRKLRRKKISMVPRLVRARVPQRGGPWGWAETIRAAHSHVYNPAFDSLHFTHFQITTMVSWR